MCQLVHTNNMQHGVLAVQWWCKQVGVDNKIINIWEIPWNTAGLGTMN